MKKLFYILLLLFLPAVFLSCNKDELREGPDVVLTRSVVLAIRFIDSLGNNVLEKEDFSYESLGHVKASLDNTRAKDLKYWYDLDPTSKSKSRFYIGWTENVFYVDGKTEEPLRQYGLDLTAPNLFGDSLAHRFDVDLNVQNGKAKVLKIVYQGKEIPFFHLKDLILRDDIDYVDGFIVIDVVVKR